MRFNFICSKCCKSTAYMLKVLGGLVAASSTAAATVAACSAHDNKAGVPGPRELQDSTGLSVYPACALFAAGGCLLGSALWYANRAAQKLEAYFKYHDMHKRPLSSRVSLCEAANADDDSMTP